MYRYGCNSGHGFHGNQLALVKGARLTAHSEKRAERLSGAFQGHTRVCARTFPLLAEVKRVKAVGAAKEQRQ